MYIHVYVCIYIYTQKEIKAKPEWLLLRVSCFYSNHQATKSPKEQTRHKKAGTRMRTIHLAPKSMRENSARALTCEDRCRYERVQSGTIVSVKIEGGSIREI